ncbi:50S ribosomal protein L9 [Corynebacterium bovis]|uniref:Large ribosomal subunit protein bL9 n=2 Tax=Corynebacterium bovis TaxID=36808 RepID=A0A3R8QIZ2_9CORY|nr:50S ribosomal protein L9 [Corynebacterium bovis]MBB3115922.1 large subunit ribosomal protein L9 [Corynebacterium bovis DSM 20582 = CIP 54.80]MDH2456877.1 50S ribosomal protein L9 [Corynebacterium bovis]MDK8511764.1 50S ribosomal protein L9 [Corynebacterium bovis]MDN8580118.1 50S ribosomal protein L9 [Corynebacterium bovis]QQC46882.1 50S ribosomal protein L9 [Corynebacterium bovis]
MKLILTAAVDNLGVPGDIVEVKAGYGRNYLLPRGYAIPATRGAEKQVENIRRTQEAKTIRDLDHAREVKDEIDHLEGVTVTVKTSDQGKLFGSVSADDIAAAVKKANGRDLDKRTILVNKGEVKTTGSFNVDVKLHPEVTASLNFKVVAE